MTDTTAEGLPFITRKEAKAAGLRHYFTGKACSRRHAAKRFVSNGVCCECLRTPEWKAYVHKLRQTTAYKVAHRTSVRAYQRTPDGKAFKRDRDRLYRQTPKGKAALRAGGRAYLKTPKGKAKHAANRHLYRAIKLSACPPWADREELLAISLACPPGHAVDHLHPLKGRWWTGRLEPGDDPRWATRYDGSDGCTRVSSGLHIPINLWHLDGAVNSAKSNRPVNPGLFNWWNEDQGTTEGTLSGREWHPSEPYDDCAEMSL